jgi:hypothetical protein
LVPKAVGKATGLDAKAMVEQIAPIIGGKAGGSAEIAMCSGSNDSFVPDANGTLRLTAGAVKGYFAADAVECHPITSVGGLLDKADYALISGVEEASNEFSVPDRFRSAMEAIVPGGPFTNDGLGGSVPVNICYSTDTVGGNSGSPVLNAKGELVGCNFDRQRLGLANEYKWSCDKSRSVGVDIRYLLWLLKTVDKADHLLKEMGVDM